MAEPKPKKPSKAERQTKFHEDNTAYRARELATAQAQHALAPDGRTALQLQFADAEHGLAQSQRAEFLAGSQPATAPAPAPEPVMAEPKPKKVRTRAGPAQPDLGYPRSSGSMPRVQPDLFGVPPQPAVTPYVPPGEPVYGPTTGTYPEAGAYPHTSPQGARTMGGTFADMARASGNDVRAVTGGDLFGDMPARPGPSTAYSSIMDADPPASPRAKFALDPREQAALWPELDTRTQGLARVTGRAPNMVELRPGVETPYISPHDPAAYGTSPMIAERSPAATYGGQAANFAKGPTAYDARPSMLSRVGSAAQRGLAYAGGVLARTAPVLDVVLPGLIDQKAEEAYTLRAMQYHVGGGRGDMPASAYPRGMSAALGVPQMNGGELFRDYAADQMDSFHTMPNGARMAGPVHQGGSGSPAITSAPAQMPTNARGQGYADPRMVRPAQPAQVARPMPRPMPRPAPWPPMQVDPSILYQGGAYANTPLPVGNANIDDETRLRAYRAMGILP